MKVGIETSQECCYIYIHSKNAKKLYKKIYTKAEILATFSVDWIR